MPSAQELGPGVRSVEVRAPFTFSRSALHNGAIAENRVPFVVSSDAAPWSYLASFAAEPEAFVAPGDERVVAWLIRVDCELVSGNASLAYAAANLSELFGERTVPPGITRVDLLLDNPARGAHLVVRQGAEPAVTTLRIEHVSAYRLIEDEGPVLARPAPFLVSTGIRWSEFYGEPVEGLAERIRYLRFLHLEHPRLMTWQDGLEVLVHPGEQVSQAVFVSGTYEPATAVVLRRLLRPGDTFVDVGANAGLLTMLGARWVGDAGRVVAFEPSWREFERLRFHLEHNRLRNVRPIRMAASDREGDVVLHVADARYSGLNTIQPGFAYDGIDEAYMETVPAGRLDDLLLGQGVTRTHVIKIDVEGSEHLVLKGAARTIERDRPALIVESISVPDGGAPSTGAVVPLLESKGYDLAAIDGRDGSLRPVRDFTGPAENFLAATADVISGLWSR